MISKTSSKMNPMEALSMPETGIGELEIVKKPVKEEDKTSSSRVGEREIVMQVENLSKTYSQEAK